MNCHDLCINCNRNTPKMGDMVCTSCHERMDKSVRADGMWDRFFAAVEAAAERHGDETLAEAAREMRYNREDALH